jgi:hypothetical protein
MNVVPSIVYTHPITEMPTLNDSVSAFSLEHSNALESASWLNAASSGRNDPAVFVPSKVSKDELMALSTNAKSGQRFELPIYPKSAKPVPTKPVPTKPVPTKPVPPKNAPKNRVKDMDDYLFQGYIGSISIVGLLILYRLIHKK